MVDQKATQVCLLAQGAYPEDRRATLVSSPPVGYLLRIEHETSDLVFRCIYAISDGRKIHESECQFELMSPTATNDGSGPDGPSIASDEAGVEGEAPC